MQLWRLVLVARGRGVELLCGRHTGSVVRENSADHRNVAARHELAAQSHERVARFWDEREDPERAQLQLEMAQHERHGAELERRWVELTDPAAVHGEIRTAELVRRHTRQGAKQASGILTQLADTLERSAGLADEHAQRWEQTGRTADAADERQAAKRAREAAQRARWQAEEWRRIGENRKQ